MFTKCKYLWHHQIHESWGSERLYFWRLAFFPTYDAEPIHKALNQVLAEHGVRSYAHYEIYGLYDTIIRVWLPTQTTPEDFERALTEKLTHFHMEVCDAFSVGQILRHWPWVDSDGSLRELDPHILRNRLEPRQIEQLNDAAAGHEPDLEAEKLIKRAVADGLLARCSFSDGIKFLVVVTSSSQLATIAARGQLRFQLESILERAEKGGAIGETSLYEGSGFGQFLLLGRVKPDKFSALRTDIIDRVNAAGTGAFFRARPYTYVTASGNGDSLEPQFVDSIPYQLDAAESTESVEQLLNRDEYEKLEMKASAFINVDRWVQTGRASPDEKVLEQGVLKAIVGMLNRSGGTVVVGALERMRYKKERRLEGVPAVGLYFCLGIEQDYQGRDWDQYALKLQEEIMKRINPPPAGLVTISKVRVADRPLAVLSIQRTTREWFYLQGTKGPAQFFVRLDNSTRFLQGPVADGYKQSHPRG